MKRLNVRCVNSLTFLILGCISNNKVVCKVGAGILQLAWRCLYAEVVRARIDDKNLNFRKTYKRTIIILISRVKAYGFKWYRWFSRTRNIRASKVKHIPLKYRNRILIKTQADGSWSINQILLDEYEKNKRDH